MAGRVLGAGSLLCSLPDACGDLMVTLQPVSRQGDKRSLQLAGSRDSVPFTFEGVLPGKYKGRSRAAAWWEPGWLFEV